MDVNKESLLIRDCVSGCRIAQRELYDSYCAQFYSICCRYTKDRQQAEQVLQDGFLKIYERIHTYQHRGSFEGWMKKIIVNTCLDFLKSKISSQKKVTYLIDQEMIESSGIAYNHGSQQMDYQHLLMLMQQLPHTTRLVFNLYAIEGYSHKEISELLNISSGTSQWHVNQARNHMKQGIEKLDRLEKKTKLKIAFNNL